MLAHQNSQRMSFCRGFFLLTLLVEDDLRAIAPRFVRELRAQIVDIHVLHRAAIRLVTKTKR